MVKSILRKVLSDRMIDSLKVRKARFHQSYYRLVNSNRYSNSIHYLVNPSFKVEQRVVAKGIDNFKHTDEGLYYSLRIEIHRIEKGLVMRPVRKMFAKKYIVSTVTKFIELTEKGFLDKNDFNWFYDVLEDYFNTVDKEDKTVKHAHSLFKSNFSNSRELTGIRQVPYVRAKPSNLINYEQLVQLAHYRRSVRLFDDRPVEKEKIDRALDIAKLSPSACNRLPYIFKFYNRDNPELLQKVVSLPPGARAFKENIPVIVAVVGKYDTFSYEGDRYNPITDSSLATMSLIYGLEVQGISSCILHWPETPHREEKAKEVLKLKDDEKVVMFMALGYPDETSKVAKSTKKENQLISTFN